MTIRFRFLFIVSLIITVGIVLSSAVTYVAARRQLEEAARLEIERAVTLVARQSEIWIDSFRTDMALLAELPLVQQTVDSPFDQELVAAASRYFRTVADGANIYQSINLFWGFREIHHGKALKRKIRDLPDSQFSMPYPFWAYFRSNRSKFGH